MIEIQEVTTEKQRKAFIRFPIDLYAGNEYYTPALTIDEKKIFKKNYVYNSTCDVVFYLAYKDGKPAGRISGIIQRAANEKWRQKRARFTRFDCIDDQEVANALFDKIVSWARSKGMTEAVGPLGYSDLEREGLLIEFGFDQVATYEENYNYAYYQKLIENYGFVKDVDWLEYKLYRLTGDMEKMIRLSNRMLEKYKLRLVQAKSINEFIKKYVREFFEVIDKTYDKIYGTVPFTEEMMQMMIENFRMIARVKDIILVIDENERIVGFSILFPSIAKVVNKHHGRITLPFLIDFFKNKRRPEVIDLGLIGVLPEYESKGVATAMLGAFAAYLEREKPVHLETNLMLEDNKHILNLMKHFEKDLNKKKRCYKLDITSKQN